ncbi:TetR/AcrR family transcriptional regulator [Acidovorax sp. JG5]|uniref:TetR/AcrR family transcriptional regulator n=1 Tax=Acidovorax sp. JG5 TaxID=2822718 RepID=UPI001B336760|nr:TetR/AcrR family transcriptional regulator [Acidovorax sp. JG5]MBP3982640.1 TetR/AcrR family transcriptional regulator [Acidovorax sp. JG5]
MTRVDRHIAAPRRGRPSAQEALLVDERVLSAATTLFLELGFGRTTLDMVSQLARTGKSALYARYPNKESLFSAVVQHSIQTMFAHMSSVDSPSDYRSRLRSAGRQLIEGMLHPRCVALMRITAAEAHNFPELALLAYRVSFDGSVRCVVSALEGALLPAGQDIKEIAHRFVEVAVQPLSFQAAFGLNPDALRQRSASSVDDAIALLCATGRLTL